MSQAIQTHLAGLAGEIMEPEIHDLGGDPQNVIRISDGFHVKLEWYLNSYSLGGYWEVTVSLEGLGSKFEGDVIPAVPVPFTSADTTDPSEPHWVFERDVTNLATLPDLKKGVYKIAVNILFVNSFGNYEPMAAFYEGPAISLF